METSPCRKVKWHEKLRNVHKPTELVFKIPTTLRKFVFTFFSSVNSVFFFSLKLLGHGLIAKKKSWLLSSICLCQ